ncbi:MAG: T9SS type A sorting domain-containing protein, partial [Chitinophagales bacterium]
TYLWSNEEETQTIDVGEGIYTVTITDSNGCTGTDQVNVTENANPEPSIAGDLEYCASAATTTLNAGSWTSYLWSNNEDTQSIDVGEGTYTVTVTDNNGCTGTDQVTVIENDNPVPSITGDLEYCASDLTTTLDAGSWSAYLWSNEEETQTIDVGEGIYTVTVTDNSGCTGTDQVTVIENANPIPNITGNLEYCASDLTTTLDAGTWSTYLWSNEEETQTIDVGEGTYTVTVTDSNGCTGTDQVTVIENANPEPSITGDLEYCASELTTTLDAGIWTSYLWSNNEDTQSIAASAGTYTVTVTDSNGCTGTDQVTVIENANPEPIITGDLEYCRGREALLDAGEYDEYQWSNGETNQSFTTTIIGVYTVTVTNELGCTGTARAEVSATPCLAEAGTLTTNAATICAGGAVEVSTTGEQTDANYLQHFFIYTQDNLDNTILQQSMVADYEDGEASAAFSGLMAGDYLVCAYNECQSCLPNPSPITTDLDDIYDTGNIQDGCFDIECTMINVPEAFDSLIEGTGLAAENDAAGQNIYIAEVCGGTAPYNIEFVSTADFFASVTTFPGSTVGCIKYRIAYVPEADWTLTVTDANDCSNEGVVFTNEDVVEPQVVGYETEQESCVGEEDGSISIEVESGNDDCNEYTYEWSGPNGFSSTVVDVTTGSEIEGLASGNYEVTVTDCEGLTTVRENIHVARENRGRGRGRGGCKTAGGDNFNNTISLIAYPNPFSQQTSIEFSIAATSKVWLSVYSIEGKKVAEILQGAAIEGNTAQRFGFDAEGLPSGTYILELQTESGLRQHQQLVVLK